MAKKSTNEKIKLSIIIDGNPAQKELYELENSIRDLNSQQKELRKEKQLLEKQGLRNSSAYKAVSASLKENTLAITANKLRMSELQKEIGLTGLTMGQLQAKSVALRQVLRNMIPGSANFNNVTAELKQVTARIDELRGKSVSAKLSIGSLADGFNRYAALGASVVATLTGVVFSIQKMIDLNGKLSDAQADVMKTTGMTKKEVDELGKSFGLLETRTSRIDLYKIAEQGGRLGIPKAEIQDFVKEMNVAAVALGDSFTGGVDEVAEKLGKIKFLFKETQDLDISTAYNSIGSAINDLGANGVASEANIAEFTKRIGSLTDVLKPTVQETLALGAAFEESGIEAETSSRAYNIFMKQASTESSKFAQVMGISKKAVEDMINTNPLNFMLEFAKGLNGMNATEVAKTLDFLGINADGANKVIGAMGNNFNRFHELIDLSNDSFAKGTSLINEYNVKNENLAATLEKVTKRLYGLFSSEGFINWLTSAVSWFAKLIGASDSMDESTANLQTRFINFIKILTIVIVSYISYNNALKLTALWTNTVSKATEIYNAIQGRGTILTNLFRLAHLALSTVFYIVTGQMTKATIAMRAFSAVAATNPLGLLLVALTSIAGAFWLFKKNADSAKDSIKKLNSETELASEINQKFNEEFGKSSSQLKEKIQPLIDVLNNQNVSLETRKQAYEKLISIAPEFKDTVDKEYNATGKLNEVYAELLQNMADKMKFQAMQNVLQSKYDAEAKALDKLIKAENNLIKAQREKAEWDSKKAFANAVNIDLVTKVKEATEAVTNAQNNLTNAEKNTALVSNYRQKQIEKLSNEQKKYNKDTKEYLDLQSKINILLGISNKKEEAVTGKSTYNIPGDKAESDKKEKRRKTIEEMNREALEAEQKFQEELLKLKRQATDDSLAVLQDDYTREMAIEDERYAREIADLQAQKIRKDELVKIDENIAKAKADGDTDYYNFLIGLKQKWGERNILLDDQINKIIEGKQSVHQLKIATIQEKAAMDAFKLEQEHYNRKKVLLDTQMNIELAAAGNNEALKKNIRKKYQDQQLQLEQDFIDKSIVEFNKLLEGLNNRVDINLLTDKQKDEFNKEIEELKLKLSELILKKAELKNNTDSTDKLSSLGLGGNTDILGFSQENWNQFFANLKSGTTGLEDLVFAFSAMTDMYSKFNDYVTANENAQLNQYQNSANKKKATLKKQLDDGLITQTQYDKKIKIIDDNLEKRKATAEYNQAKRQRLISTAQIIANTATAIMKVWAEAGPFAAPFLTGLVSAIGALQLATVLKTPLPSKGYEDGLYPDYVKRQQDGKVFRSNGVGSMNKSGLYNKPTILVGEGPGDMPEMIVDKRSFSRINPEVRNAFIRELNGVRGFEKGYYDNKGTVQIPIADNQPTNNNNDELLKMNMAVMSETLAVLKDIRENPLLAVVSNKDYNSMKKLDEGIQDYKDLVNKNKV